MKHERMRGRYHGVLTVVPGINPTAVYAVDEVSRMVRLDLTGWDATTWTNATASVLKAFQPVISTAATLICFEAEPISIDEANSQNEMKKVIRLLAETYGLRIVLVEALQAFSVADTLNISRRSRWSMSGHNVTAANLERLRRSALSRGVELGEVIRPRNRTIARSPKRRAMLENLIASNGLDWSVFEHLHPTKAQPLWLQSLDASGNAN